MGLVDEGFIDYGGSSIF